METKEQALDEVGELVDDGLTISTFKAEVIMENGGLIKVVIYLMSGWQFSGVKSMETKEQALDEVGELIDDGLTIRTFKAEVIMENGGLIKVVNYLMSGWQFSGVKSMETKEQALDEVGELIDDGLTIRTFKAEVIMENGGLIKGAQTCQLRPQWEIVTNYASYFIFTSNESFTVDPAKYLTKMAIF